METQGICGSELEEMINLQCLTVRPERHTPYRQHFRKIQAVSRITPAMWIIKTKSLMMETQNVKRNAYCVMRKMNHPQPIYPFTYLP